MQIHKLKPSYYRYLDSSGRTARTTKAMNREKVIVQIIEDKLEYRKVVSISEGSLTSPFEERKMVD